MERSSLSKFNRSFKKAKTISNFNENEPKLYTPEIIKKYQEYFNRILKITNDKTKTQFILYKRVIKWYEDEENINISMERIFIKSKLGSYTSGGCGISASLFAGITASSIFSYMDNYLKKLNPSFMLAYAILILFFGIKILSKEDKKVEMYNMLLEALNNLEYDKNENLG